MYHPVACRWGTVCNAGFGRVDASVGEPALQMVPTCRTSWPCDACLQVGQLRGVERPPSDHVPLLLTGVNLLSLLFSGPPPAPRPCSLPPAGPGVHLRLRGHSHQGGGPHLAVTGERAPAAFQTCTCHLNCHGMAGGALLPCGESTRRVRPKPAGRATPAPSRPGPPCAQVQCRQSDTELLNCRSLGWGVAPGCTHRQDVGVLCS